MCATSQHSSSHSPNAGMPNKRVIFSAATIDVVQQEGPGDEEHPAWTLLQQSQVVIDGRSGEGIAGFSTRELEIPVVPVERLQRQAGRCFGVEDNIGAVDQAKIIRPRAQSHIQNSP